jgi:hypothetical protein
VRVALATPVALASIALVTTQLAGPAGASCAYVQDDDSPVILVGVVQEVRSGEDQVTYGAVADVRVERWIRGGSGETATALTNAGLDVGPGQFMSVSDGRTAVQPGERWELHASIRPDGRLDTACQTSTLLATGLPVPARGPSWMIVGPAVALGAVVTAIGVVLISRRRRPGRTADAPPH